MPRPTTPPDVTSRLGYLLKHAAAEFEQLSLSALAPLGVDPRELGVLLVIAGHDPASQQQIAHRLGVDRTSMVAMLDGLEAKQIVSRRPDAEDRRRNVIELTAAGADLLQRAIQASDEAERTFLAALDPRAAQQLRDALRAVLAPHG